MSQKIIPVLLTVKQFSDKHKMFSAPALRYQIYISQTNGLAASGAILRIGRKLLIDEAKFFTWLESQSGVQS